MPLFNSSLSYHSPSLIPLIYHLTYDTFSLIQLYIFPQSLPFFLLSSISPFSFIPFALTNLLTFLFSFILIFLSFYFLIPLSLFLFFFLPIYIYSILSHLIFSLFLLSLFTFISLTLIPLSLPFSHIQLNSLISLFLPYFPSFILSHPIFSILFLIPLLLPLFCLFHFLSFSILFHFLCFLCHTLLSDSHFILFILSPHFSLMLLSLLSNSHTLSRPFSHLNCSTSHTFH